MPGEHQGMPGELQVMPGERQVNSVDVYNLQLGKGLVRFRGRSDGQVIAR